jgi:hypothetical protein
VSAIVKEKIAIRTHWKILLAQNSKLMLLKLPSKPKKGERLQRVLFIVKTIL